MVRACHEAEVPWVRAARARGCPRRAAGRGGHPDRALAPAANPRGGHPQRPRAGGARRDEYRRLAGDAAALLPAGPVEPDRLHDRRNVAENSGGAHCFKYGFTTNYVTGLELVLPDGSEVTLGGPELDHPGYDLLGAFVGSEGTLGIATKIWLRVVPKPEAVRTLVAFFGSTVRGGRGGLADRVRGHRAGRDRDDGQPLDPCRRGRHKRGLPRGRRRGGCGRAGRLRGRVRDPLRARDQAVPGRTASGWPRTRPSAS